MWSLGSTLFMLLFAGIPIGISLAGATAIGVLFDDFLTYSTLFEAFFSFLTKYTLVAIPFFIFAGFLMERTGLVAGLFRLADSLRWMGSRWFCLCNFIGGSFIWCYFRFINCNGSSNECYSISRIS